MDEITLPPPLPGYKKIQPYIFAGIYCIDTSEYNKLKDALEKISLNDASISFEPEVSPALGFGFRCGFLGLLHLEIINERLRREFDLDLIITIPNVKLKLTSKSTNKINLKQDNEGFFIISNPAEIPDKTLYNELYEPWSKIEIITPKEYAGNIMQLTEEKHGVFQDMIYIDENLVILKYEIPLQSIIIDYYDRLKSISSGYASMSYEYLEYRAGDLVKVDIFIAKELMDAFSFVCHKDDAYHKSLELLNKLKEAIPRHQFAISLQASIGSKVIAREDIKAFRKDVTAHLYGGDITRRMKLLEKQKKGKKKMKQLGNVNIPQEAFLSILKNK